MEKSDIGIALKYRSMISTQEYVDFIAVKMPQVYNQTKITTCPQTNNLPIELDGIHAFTKFCVEHKP